MNELVPIRVAATALGVSTSTLRRWEATGRLVPLRTEGGQRRYDLAALGPGYSHAAQPARQTIAYARVSNQGEESSFEEDLASDVLQIITVFSARLYGNRSHRNKNQIDGVRQAVREAKC